MPTRIQRRRTAGWRAPRDAAGRLPVYVGRGSRWGNPFPVVRHADGTYGVPATQGQGTQWRTCDTATEARAEAVRLYRTWVADRPWVANSARRDLAGRDLMCWCPAPEPGWPDHCHGAVLLRLAAG
uniref:DUF4326 domain-containing protein n=1 Tax=Wenjunlia vitaminophila TaxID=76728 RepID=UPI00036FA863